MTRYSVTGRTVLITGSTGGLGAALSKELRARGANLALLDLDRSAVAAQATQLGGDTVAAGFVADVRDMSSLQKAIDAAAAHFGRIDVVIANAGIDTVAPMASLEPSSFERVIDINLTGVWRTFKAALPHVRKQHGYLLAISSMAAFVHSPLQCSYTASKAGVWAMCDSIRLELRSSGVGVGSAHPTFFKTPLMDHVHKDPAGHELWGGNAKGVLKMIPLHDVVDGIADGIERRATKIVVPKSLTLTANAPGFFRQIFERLGFRDSSIQKAAALASPTGWNDEPAKTVTSAGKTA